MGHYRIKTEPFNDHDPLVTDLAYGTISLKKIRLQL